MNAAVRDIPIRFGRGAGGFEIKIKSSGRSRISDMETPLVQRLFDLNGRAHSIEVMPLPLLRRQPVMAAVTLSKTVLDERRFEAVLKNTRKKRC